MRQTAEKAVPFAKSGAKPQRESELFKKKQKHRETLGKNRRRHPAQSRVYYHSEVRTPIATAMFGEYAKQELNNNHNNIHKLNAEIIIIVIIIIKK